MKCFDRARSDYTKYPFEHRLHFRCHTFKQLIQSNKESTFWLPIQNKVQSQSKTEILQEWFYLSYERVYNFIGEKWQKMIVDELELPSEDGLVVFNN